MRKRLRFPRLEVPACHSTDLQHSVVARRRSIVSDDAATTDEIGYRAKKDVVRCPFWVTEHIEIDRLREGVEVGEDLAALGAEGVGVVEDRGDATLFAQRGERHRKLRQHNRTQARQVRAGGTRRCEVHHARLGEVVGQEALIQVATRPNGKDVCAAHPVEVRSADLAEVWTQLSEENVLGREAELGAGHLRFGNGAATDDSSATFEVLQTEIGSFGRQSAWINTSSLDRRDLTERN